jgi:hypothetical protein
MQARQNLDWVPKEKTDVQKMIVIPTEAMDRLIVHRAVKKPLHLHLSVLTATKLRQWPKHSPCPSSTHSARMGTST